MASMHISQTRGPGFNSRQTLYSLSITLGSIDRRRCTQGRDIKAILNLDNSGAPGCEYRN